MHEDQNIDISYRNAMPGNQAKIMSIIKNCSSNILYYYPYRAFGGQNKIVYSTHFVTRRAIILLLPGLHVSNHLTLIYVYDLS